MKRSRCSQIGSSTFDFLLCPLTTIASASLPDQSLKSATPARTLRRHHPDGQSRHFSAGSRTNDLPRREFEKNWTFWPISIPRARIRRVPDPGRGSSHVRARNLRHVGRPNPRFARPDLHRKRQTSQRRMEPEVGSRNGARHGNEREGGFPSFPPLPSALGPSLSAVEGMHWMESKDDARNSRLG
jgi:hypothetical protein